MEVFDWRRYENTHGYCPGDDEFSRSVEQQRIWEGFNTVLAMAILDPHRPRQIGFIEESELGVVLDFGANLGWFTKLATLAGRDVLAIEADAAVMAVLQRNVTTIEWLGHPFFAQGWIGPDTPQLSAGPRVRFLKSDVEGNENHVVRVCANLFKDRLVDYAMLEVSPIFAPHYPDTLQWIVSCGYTAHLIPGKGYDIARFSADPVGCTLAQRIDGPEMRATVSAMRQADVLMVRSEA